MVALTKSKSVARGEQFFVQYRMSEVSYCDEELVLYYFHLILLSGSGF